MVGAGISVLSDVAVHKAGPAAIVSFIFSAFFAILLGRCYAELASRYPKAGGSYEYVRQTMGSFVGTIIDWAYWGAWLAASSFAAPPQSRAAKNSPLTNFMSFYTCP